MSRNLESRIQRIEDHLEPGISRTIVIRTEADRAALERGDYGDLSDALIVHIVREGPDVPDRPTVLCPAPASPLPPRATEPAADDTPAAPEPESPPAATMASGPVSKKKEGHVKLMADVNRWFTGP